MGGITVSYRFLLNPECHFLSENRIIMQDIKEEIIAAGLPEHIAIIMDGNGRWEQRGLDRVYGHKQGGWIR